MRSSIRSVVLGAAVTAALCRAGFAAEPFRYEGMCEASAAVALDDARFVVASDDLEVLTVYERGKAAPVATVPLADVTDLEAASRIGDTIFWLTSHSLNKDGEDKKKRKQLFATTVAPDGAVATRGTVSRSLRETVAAQLGLDEAALSTAFNIEGLAATPDGALLAGLRAPLTGDGKAQVVRIDDPFTLVGLSSPADGNTAAARAAPAIAAVSILDLGGRGVRSLERVGERYLIVAGSVEDGGKAPALYWWEGAGAVTPGPDVSLVGLTPEALFAWSDGTVQILGDNGNACDEKDKKPKWFPSIDVRP